MSTNKEHIDNKDDSKTLDRWEKAYTQAPPVMRPDSHGNDAQLANYPKAGDWGLKIPAGLEKAAVSKDRSAVDNLAIETKQTKWLEEMNKRHVEMRKDLSQQPLVDQERMNLSIQTEKAAFEKWTNPDRNTISGAKVHDTYINTFSKLIAHDKEQGHPVADIGRDFKAEPISAREQYDWLKREGRETTALERSYIQSTDLWNASVTPSQRQGAQAPQDFDKEVFGKAPAQHSEAPKAGAPNVEARAPGKPDFSHVQQMHDQTDAPRPQLDMGGLKDRLTTRRMPSHEELVAEHKQKFGGAKFKNEGMSYEERVIAFADVSQKASEVGSGIPSKQERPSQGLEMDKKKHKVSI